MCLPASMGLVRPPGGGGGGPVSYIGGTFSVDLSSAAPSLAVPVGATSGDTVIAILRCRGDRTMSGFTGWTTIISSVLPSTDPGGTGNSRVYILTRTLAAETSFAFTQSASAAYGAALLVFRGGVVGTNTLVDATSGSITKSGANSMLLAVSLYNQSAVSPTTVNPTFASYTNRGYSYFFSSPSYFYVVVAETRSGVPAGSTTATGNPPSASGRATWLAEIG